MSTKKVVNTTDSAFVAGGVRLEPDAVAEVEMDEDVQALLDGGSLQTETDRNRRRREREEAQQLEQQQAERELAERTSTPPTPDDAGQGAGEE